MQEFTTHTGIGVPLRRSNVDTDQIIPAVYLKRVTRTGFADALFHAWRQDPCFVLNSEPYAHGSVLVAGPDFGTGSSREHAVWALMDYGFKVVIASRFADIFKGNCGKAGLLTALLSESDVEQLMTQLEQSPGLNVSVDLLHQKITAGEATYSFDIDDYTKHRLINGLDDISVTLKDENLISQYEANRASFLPTTLPILTKE
ncbi:MAG: 3-isopropylmalate dehydratase small subunit [Propionibacteriaceae bacterium]|nr:3-isopropylmalate dehydratase small subunit [Propionibacteriaceae bacterium]